MDRFLPRSFQGKIFFDLELSQQCFKQIQIQELSSATQTIYFSSVATLNNTKRELTKENVFGNDLNEKLPVTETCWVTVALSADLIARERVVLKKKNEVNIQRKYPKSII